MGPAQPLRVRLLTERRTVEDALRSSEQRFRSLVQNSSDLILVCDADGVLTYVSPASQTILGIDDTELIGRTVEELVHCDMAQGYFFAKPTPEPTFLPCSWTTLGRRQRLPVRIPRRWEPPSTTSSPCSTWSP